MDRSLGHDPEFGGTCPAIKRFEKYARGPRAPERAPRAWMSGEFIPTGSFLGG